MLRFVTICAVAMAQSSGAPNPPFKIFRVNISPEEAANFINSPPFTEPQLLGQTGVQRQDNWNDPSYRTAEAGPNQGYNWKNGRENDNNYDYVGERRETSRFYGQDGLGGYAYGYRTPQSAKVEKRERSGDLAGSFSYKIGNDLYKARYWSDGNGFHQEDNLADIQQPPQETWDVHRARLAHEKAWQEAAAGTAQNPYPQGGYNSNYDYQPAASEQQNQQQQYDQQQESGRQYRQREGGSGFFYSI